MPRSCRSRILEDMERQDPDDEWALFCRRQACLWQFAEQIGPGSVRDATGEIRRGRLGERVVRREFPRDRDASTQTEDTSTMSMCRPPALMGLRVEKPRAETIRRAGESQQNPPPCEGCWNCEGLHRYSQCEQERGIFCFGCGAQGVTLTNCDRCGRIYRRVGPYGGPRGPRDHSRPARLDLDGLGRTGATRKGDEEDDWYSESDGLFPEFPEIA